MGRGYQLAQGKKIQSILQKKIISLPHRAGWLFH
jgi:hypothetical protein